MILRVRERRALAATFYQPIIIPPEPLSASTVWGIIRFDIKDYSMSGEHDLIVDTCSSFIAQPFRHAWSEMAKTILASQYVATRSFT